MFRFSIVIPLFNKEFSIRATIASVLAQTHSGFELIVVNDGSTDNSLGVLAGFKEARIKVYSKANGGVSSARNYGIEKASCEFVAFLDADDIWEPDFLQTIASLIGQYPDAGLYATGYCRELSNGTRQSPKLRYVDNCAKGGLIADYFKSASFETPVFTSAVCIPKKVLTSVGPFRPGVKRGEDLDMWVRVALSRDIAFYNSVKVRYRVDAGNNAGLSFSSVHENYPYWEWYEYPCGKKASLSAFTTAMIFALARRAIRHARYDEALFCLSRCRGSHMIVFRTLCYILALLLSAKKKVETA